MALFIKKNEWGISFLEILIILAILGALTAIVVPGLASTMKHNKILTTSQNIKSLLDETKNLAIASNQTITVNISSLLVATTNRSITAETSPNETIELSNGTGVSLNYQIATLLYNPNGSITFLNNFQIPQDISYLKIDFDTIEKPADLIIFPHSGACHYVEE